MNFKSQFYTILCVFLSLTGIAQNVETHRVHFENSNGVNGYVVLKTKPTTVGNAFLWVQQEKVVIERVDDGMEYFSSSNNNLTPYSITFPYTCTDCYFTTDVLVSMLIKGDAVRVSTWSDKSSSVHYGSSGKSNVFIPWSEAIKKRHDGEERVEGESKAWERTGACEKVRITSDVEGVGINNILSAIRSFKRDEERREKEEQEQQKTQQEAERQKKNEQQKQTEEEKEEKIGEQEQEGPRNSHSASASRYSSYMKSGLDAEQRGDYSKAIEYYEMAYSINPSPELRIKIENLQALLIAGSFTVLNNLFGDVEIGTLHSTRGLMVSRFRSYPNYKDLSLGFDMNHCNKFFMTNMGFEVNGMSSRNIDIGLKVNAGLGVGTNKFGLYFTGGVSLLARVKSYNNDDVFATPITWGFLGYIVTNRRNSINIQLKKIVDFDDPTFNSSGYLPGTWWLGLGYGWQF